MRGIVVADERGRQESTLWENDARRWKDEVGGESGELWKPKATRLPLKAHAATTSLAVIMVVDGGGDGGYLESG